MSIDVTGCQIYQFLYISNFSTLGNCRINTCTRLQYPKIITDKFKLIQARVREMLLLTTVKHISCICRHGLFMMSTPDIALTKQEVRSLGSSVSIANGAFVDRGSNTGRGPRSLLSNWVLGDRSSNNASLCSIEVKNLWSHSFTAHTSS
jgi:hypothetical protein